MLQPLVENCVEHGFKHHKKRARCVIDLLAQADGETLFLRLTDNGEGMSGETAGRVMQDMQKDLSYQNEHIGLNNLWHRLRLAYGDKCRMDFKSREGYYTQVNIVIPLGSALASPPSGDSSPGIGARHA